MTYIPRTKPRAHQVEGLLKLKNRPSKPSSEDVFAWLMEYGTGKSKQVCDEYGEREEAGDLHDLFIIAEAGSYLNWIDDKTEKQLSQFHAHMSDDLNDRLRAEKWISGAGAMHMRRLEALVKETSRPRALVMNIEALSTSEKARGLAKAFLGNSKRRAMMVVDESTSIKSEGAKRTQQIIKLGGDSMVRRIMTGMVTPNSPLDLYSQFMFLDWRVLGYTSSFAFRGRYAIMKDIEVAIPGKKNRDGSQAVRRVKIDVAYRNLEELQEKIEPYSFRKLTADCLDLPPLTYAPIRDVELTDEQRRIYKELHEEAIADLGGESFVSATMVITRNLRLQQLLCGFIVDADGVERDIPSNRGRELLEVLSHHSGKAIIWCPFHNPLQKIVKALKKEYGEKSVAEFHGKNIATRAEDERRFLGDPECRFMVSTQSAGGRGNTWVDGINLMIYFANTDNLELRMNSEARFYRDGQVLPCTVVDFQAAGTNEIKTVQNLRDKLTIATIINGDNYKEWII